MCGDGAGADEKALQLDVQLCLALHVTARAIANVYAEILREQDMTYPQYLVLITLLEQDGLTVSEIGRRLHLDSGTLSPLIERMRARKILSKKRSSEDERQVQIWLTENGRGLGRLASRARQHVVDRLGMTNPEIMSLRNQLMIVADCLNQPADCESD